MAGGYLEFPWREPVWRCVRIVHSLLLARTITDPRSRKSVANGGMCLGAQKWEKRRLAFKKKA
jgi:hypothetical protein